MKQQKEHPGRVYAAWLKVLQLEAQQPMERWSAEDRQALHQAILEAR